MHHGGGIVILEVNPAILFPEDTRRNVEDFDFGILRKTMEVTD